ncbi:MAG: hypothetical protein ACKO45_07680 [Cyanobium sp.]
MTQPLGRGAMAQLIPLGRLGIAAIRLSAAETGADFDTLEQWLQSSSPTPAP